MVISLFRTAGGLYAPQEQGGDLDEFIRASLQRADQEIRQVLQKLDSGSGLPVSPELTPEDIDIRKEVEQRLREEIRSMEMFRDANTQTPEDILHGERKVESCVNEAVEVTPDVCCSETQTDEEKIIPIRLQMDASEWYHGRPSSQLWNIHHSQVYIETTDTTYLPLEDGKGARPPYMQVTIEDVHAYCGETAQFDAVIDGSPPLTVTWYKDNTLLKDGDRIQLVRDGRKCSMVIRSTERGDGGVYTCVARNGGGEVSCKAELVMQEDEKEEDTKIVHKRRKLKSFFEVKEEIGRGSFGFVKRVVHKGNGATCAAKFIPLRSKTRQQAYRERDILSEVSHERITLLLDAFETKKTLILILEICCGEELLDRLFRKHTITEKEVKLYIRQLLEAVAYLHEKNILHLDIKPSNILMVHTDKEDIKLCDFGFSQKIIQSEFQYSKYGSPEFVPPEIAAQAPVSKSSDIWPVGVISYLCLVSASPFAGQNDRETLMNVQQGKISWSCPGFTQLSANAQDFMRQAIQMSPDARPSATQCLQHKWFVEVSSPEETQPVSSKNLRFLVARSRWQRSLMCYKSILVMRSIPELLNGKQESTSLGVPRHLVECSSSSSSSGSSSDNESDVSPTARDCNPSLELHLSIFKMSEKDGLQQPSTPEPEMDKDTKGIPQEEENMESKDVAVRDTSPMIGTKREHDKASGLGESQEDLKDNEKMLVRSVETSPGVLPLYRAATIEVGGLASKKAKTGSFIRGTSADSALLIPREAEKPSLVCVPRQSIINSTFYNQAGEGHGTAPRDATSKDKDFIKHRERARRSLMKAGYSQKILSGLREPLLEQFAMEQGILSQDSPQMDQMGSLKKSASFDLAKVSLRSSFKVSSRSRSLDDNRSRPLSVYKGTVVEEKDHISTKTSREALNKSDTATTKPHSEEYWTAPPKVSSTQRPLSAPPSDRDNTIIAVFHQQPLQDNAECRAKSSSAVMGGEESTIIAFIKPKQITESESVAKTSSVVIKDTDVCPTPQSPGKASRESEQPTDLQTGVKFTVHTTSQRNEFLVSDAPVERTPDRVNKFFPKDEEGEEETKICEGQIHLVHFREDNSRLAVIHQGAGDILSLSKDITSQEVEECPTMIMMQPKPVLDSVFPDRTLTELVIPDRPDHEHKLKPCVDQTFERDANLFVSLAQTLESGITVQGDSMQIPGKDLPFSAYTDDQCVTIDELVGEMSSLSEEMEVLANEQRETSQVDPTFPSLVDQTKEPPELQDVGHFRGELQAMETEPSPLDDPIKEPPIVSISQCSYYESLSQARVSPAPLEHFEEFTVESCSSSKTFISHSDSSGTGRRSDNFSDLEETGRHSEVSLVEIGGIHREASSNDSNKTKLVPFDLESTHLNDFYDMLTFQQHFTTEKNSQPAKDLSEAAMETSVKGAAKDTKTATPLQPLQPSDPGKTALKERKSSRKRIKLFRHNGKSETKSSESSLKQKVKASVANISRIIKKRHGNGKDATGTSEVQKVPVPEQAATIGVSVPPKKKGLSSFRLPSLSGKEKAPAFVEELTDQTVVVGHLVTLSCRTAQSVTNVEWFKDGVTIQSNERVLISSTLKNYHLLTILVVNSQDFGIYACVATNLLGSASTCCILKKAEIPCCPTSPDVAQVYRDGALLVWKPVESNTPVTYFLQYRKEGEEWRALTLDISDCCYSTHNLSEGHLYSFRIACISKAGMGPYSNPSPSVRIGRPSPANLSGLREAGGPQGTPDGDQSSDLQKGVKRGRFSAVRLCTEKSTGRLLAAKIIPYTEETKESTLLEYHILKKLHHTNVVQLHGAFLSPRDLALILELCEGRELLRCLSVGQSYSELEVRDYLWQILSAVEFLHAKQILHLDLRSENTIVTEHKLLKILDFGNAQFYSPDKVISPQRYTDYMETMAPEVLEGQGAIPPTDIWAVGITAFIMLSADYPFSPDCGAELEKDIKKGLIKFGHCYAGLSGGAVRFLQSALWANPWGRPSASDCLKMPWLQEAGLATLQQQPPVYFPSAKLRSFLHRRADKTAASQSAGSSRS